MADLAYNIQGDPFEVPDAAVAWRVRRCPKRRKGAPEVIYGRDGTPLSIPIDATISVLRAEVQESGRYRLEPLDEDDRLIADATPAYVQVFTDTARPGDQEAAERSSTRTLESLLVELTHANIESTRTTSALGKSIVEGFSGLINSVVGVVRVSGAGHGAATPALAAEGEQLNQEEIEDIEASPAGIVPGIDLNAVVGQVVTSVVTGVMSGQVKIPSLGSLLDWRRAAMPVGEPTTEARRTSEAPAPSPSASPKAAEPASGSAVRPPAESPPSPSAPNAAAQALSTLSPLEMGRLMAVQQALTPEERTLALALIQELGAADLQLWAKELSRLPLEAAVARVRETFREEGAATSGGAS